MINSPSIRIALMLGAVVLLILTLGFCKAEAHSWYPGPCCHDQDCHPVPCDEIHLRGEFYWYHGLHLNKDHAQVSPDGECHICVHAEKTIMCLWLGGVS